MVINRNSILCQLYSLYSIWFSGGASLQRLCAWPQLWFAHCETFYLHCFWDILSKISLHYNSLMQVKHFIWKSGSDLVLHYRPLQWAENCSWIPPCDHISKVFCIVDLEPFLCVYQRHMLCHLEMFCWWYLHDLKEKCWKKAQHYFWHSINSPFKRISVIAAWIEDDQIYLRSYPPYRIKVIVVECQNQKHFFSSLNFSQKPKSWTLSVWGDSTSLLSK